jgi:dihydrolipoamide dehydrogenase
MQVRHAEDFGVNVRDTTALLADWVTRQRAVIAKLNDELARALDRHKITVLRGHANLIDDHQVRISSERGTEELEAEHIIVATGASPALFPPCPQVDRKIIGFSDDFIHLTATPESLLIIGGGYIGCEFANVFSVLGTRVTLVTEHPHLLIEMDPEAGSLLQRKFESRGIRVVCGQRIERLIPAGDIAVATLEDGSRIESPRVLLAVGRRPNSRDLGLEKIGVKVDTQGAIEVNDHLQTNVAQIYAIGDVNGRAPVAHSASAQAHVAIGHALGDEITMDFSSIPFCVYTQPEITSVGFTEAQARHAGYEVTIGICPFRSVGRAVAMGELDGFVKVVIDARSHRLLGGVIIGIHAAELIAQLTLAIRLGATAEAVAETIFAHPTLSEAIPEAARRAIRRQLLWP